LELNWQSVQEQSLIQVMALNCFVSHLRILDTGTCMHVEYVDIVLSLHQLKLTLFSPPPLLAAWWQQHGISCLELQRIAVRILSQTCSSFGCEHNWSIFDQIYSQRHNRLAQRRLNDLIYVHYNLRLRERQLRKSSDEISLDSVLIERLLDDWIVEAEKPALEDDEVSMLIKRNMPLF
jgi:hypothetical protein